MEQSTGAPRSRASGKRSDDRMVSELLGVCKGLIADGVVNDAEVIALSTWLNTHRTIATEFPARQLIERLMPMTKDGIIEDDEREAFAQMLADLVGEDLKAPGGLDNSTRLPLDDPPPFIQFDGQEFVFTGNFCISRRTCELRVTDRAGIFSENIRQSTDYLIVGTVASSAWVTAAWGRKILRAMEMKKSGHPIAIVSEADWLAAIEYGG